MQSWWKDYPWRLIQTNLREIDMLDIDAAEYVRQMQSFGATVAMINVGGIIASYQTDLPFHFQSPYLKGDSLKTIIDALHAAGIKVVARTDFSKVREPVFVQHPDWAFRTVDGKVINYHGDVHACINGGYQQGAAFDILKEINEKLDIDGLFINMGGFQTRDYSYVNYGLCHCDNCKRLFKKRFGLALPKAPDMTDPAYRKYRVFQREVMLAYNEKLLAACRGLNPQISINGVDFFRMESNTEYKRPLPFWQYSASSNTRVHRGVQQNTVVSNTTVDFIGFPYRHVTVSPAQQGLRMWQNLANLGNVDFYLIGRLDNHQDRSGYEPIRKAFLFHKKHEADFAHLHSVAEALLIRGAHWGSSHEELGWIRALTEKHFLFDEAIPEEALQGDWSHYKVIILPCADILSDEMVRRLDEFAAAGGCVVSSGWSGRYDGDFEPREALPLACLGIENQLHAGDDLLGAYLEMTREEKSVFTSFPDTELVVPGDHYLYNTYKQGAATFMHLIPPQLPGPPERCYAKLTSDFPGLVVNTHGKGKGVFVPWLPGTLYTREGYDNSLWFMADVLTLAGLTPVDDGCLTPMVEVTLGKALSGTHALAQLVNTTGHFGTSYFAPVRVTDIALSLPVDKPVREAIDLVSGNAVPFAQANGRVAFTVPTLDEYGCVKLVF